MPDSLGRQAGSLIAGAIQIGKSGLHGIEVGGSEAFAKPNLESVLTLHDARVEMTQQGRCADRCQDVGVGSGLLENRVAVHAFALRLLALIEHSPDLSFLAIGDVERTIGTFGHTVRTR